MKRGTGYVDGALVDDLFHTTGPRVLDATARLRDIARAEAAVHAAKLRAVADLAELATSAAHAELACGPRVSGQPDATTVVDSAVVTEVAVVLGIGESAASDLIDLARRLTRVLPDTLHALEQGRVDLPRARAVAEATRDCDTTEARAIEALVLPQAGSAPWTGPSPRAWRSRCDRTTAAIAPYSARVRRVRALRDRCVRTWAEPDGTGVLRLVTGLEHIALAETVIRDLAAHWPAEDPDDPDGRPLTVDQRRADALVGLLRRVRDGEPLPTVSARASREPDVGVVLHTETLVADGPARYAPGTVHGIGAPATVDALTARQLATAALGRGAALRVLLTTASGRLEQVVRLHSPAEDGWTRDRIVAAVRAAIGAQPDLRTSAYAPTAAITRHVQARNPHCTSYDCPRAASRCDLDHDEPWPRGPTDADNLQPRCPRHHVHKTRRLVHTTLQPDGSVRHRMLTGLLVTTRPGPLPGHGPGEGYDG